MMVGEKINSVTIDLPVSQVCAFITIFACLQMIHISSDIKKKILRIRIFCIGFVEASVSLM